VSSEVAAPDGDPLGDPSALADTGEVPVVTTPAVKPKVSAKASGRAAKADAASTEWHLPELSLLKRSREQRQDERQLDLAGEALVASLGAHGVEDAPGRADGRAPR